MVGAVHELAVVSRVFEAMFCDRWQKGGDTVIEVDIPDVGTTAFAGHSQVNGKRVRQ